MLTTDPEYCSIPWYIYAAAPALLAVDINFGYTAFNKACQRHDVCYDHGDVTYGYNRSRCDKNFLIRMENICWNTFAETAGQKTEPYPISSEECKDNPANCINVEMAAGISFYGAMVGIPKDLFNWCEGAALKMYEAVDIAGESHYPGIGKQTCFDYLHDLADPEIETSISQDSPLDGCYPKISFPDGVLSNGVTVDTSLMNVFSGGEPRNYRLVESPTVRIANLDNSAVADDLQFPSFSGVSRIQVETLAVDPIYFEPIPGATSFKSNIVDIAVHPKPEIKDSLEFTIPITESKQITLTGGLPPFRAYVTGGGTITDNNDSDPRTFLFSASSPGAHSLYFIDKLSQQTPQIYFTVTHTHVISINSTQMLDWEPESGHWRLWEYDKSLLNDPLVPLISEGNFFTIREGHQLISFQNEVLDWVPETGDYRLWKYNPNDHSDPLPSYVKDRNGNRINDNWYTIRTGHHLVAVKSNGTSSGWQVLDWYYNENTGQYRYKLWDYDPQNLDPLVGPVCSGSMYGASTMNIISMNDSPSEGTELLKWYPATGSYFLYHHDPTCEIKPFSDASKAYTNDGVRIYDQWETIRSGHTLVPLGNEVLDWVINDGKWRLWNYSPSQKDPLNPLISSGQWHTIRTGHVLIPVIEN